MPDKLRMRNQIQEGGVSLATSLPVKCAVRGCSRNSFSVEQTPHGLAIVIRHKHDGEWHESKYRYDFIKNVLVEEKS